MRRGVTAYATPRRPDAGAPPPRAADTRRDGADQRPGSLPRTGSPRHAGAERRAGGDRRDRGAVLVEFAGLFPLILVMLAAIWQCILVGYTFSLAGNAADEAARAAAAASGDPAAACAEAALEHVPGAWEAEVSCPLEGNVRKAHVSLDVPVLFPGGFNLPITVSGSAGTTEEDR